MLRARNNFLNFGFVKAPFLVSPETKQQVAAEVERLITEHGVRRDLVFEQTGDTPRRMRNVRQHEIARYGEVVPTVYRSPELRAALGEIAGEEVLECPYEPEQCVITELVKDGDTHGWHWDDYSFALVWVIDCPPLEDGGFVQCVPRTTWNKADPQLHRQFVNQPIYSLELTPGDLYFMRTDTTLHRVYPVHNGRRLIINMGYAARRDLLKDIDHGTMDTLWEGGQ
ncbi:hypothetical protein M8542_08505 [Amycolatopsis sp. OK19-0408]|uniref:Fe2OG dioxygenase domain-containing protein n=1 Tax=Amycolatopsis iheyensis TaxID=2945988 RepID=A0A9X2SHL3_9PSEU|nr:hypothetical protein [Amycolatopsis iheyensis]MCR6482857.1 hypothetical protein [Amycolatopsis iheyensis]